MHDPCMMHKCMIHIFLILIPDPDTCMHLWCMYLWCMHVCMILVWCTNVWYIYFWSWSLILIHACIHDAYICDAAYFVTNGPTDQRTNEQGDSRSWIDSSLVFLLCLSLSLLLWVCLLFVCLFAISLFVSLYICCLLFVYLFDLIDNWQFTGFPFVSPSSPLLCVVV